MRNMSSSDRFLLKPARGKNNNLKQMEEELVPIMSSEPLFGHVSPSWRVFLFFWEGNPIWVCLFLDLVHFLEKGSAHFLGPLTLRQTQFSVSVCFCWGGVSKCQTPPKSHPAQKRRLSLSC